MKDFNIEALEKLSAGFVSYPSGDYLLDSRYDWQKNQNGVEWPYYRFFHFLSRLYEPKMVLEIGSYQGTAAAHFAAGNPEATVITVDHHSDPGDEENALKVLEVLDEYSNIIFYRGWSTPKLAATQKGKHALGDVKDVYQNIVDSTLYHGTKIDILFIDGWHHYEWARLDWETYSPLLNEPALVICDDIQEGGGEFDPIQGMLKFWDELPEPKFLNANLHPGTNMGFLKYG